MLLKALLGVDGRLRGFTFFFHSGVSILLAVTICRRSLAALRT